MRIAIIPSWYSSGKKDYFSSFSEALSVNGVSIAVFVMDIISLKYLTFRKKQIHSNLIFSTTLVRKRYYKIPFDEFLNVFFWSFFTKRMVCNYYKKNVKPDLLLIQSSFWAGYAGMLISKKLKVPYLIIEHRGRFISDSVYTNSLVKWYHLFYLKKVFTHSAKVIAVSDPLKKGLQKLFSLQEDRIKVVPNFIDLSIYKPLQLKKNSDVTFFALGTLADVKAYDLLIQAASILKLSGIANFKVLIGGKGEKKQALLTLISDLHLENHVFLLGQLNNSEVVETMNKSHVFVVSSRIESFSLVAIEALACGIPVLATKCGGPESIINENNGLLVDRESADALYSGMRWMMDQYKNFNSEKIISDVAERFGREKIIQEHIHIYKKVLHGIAK